MNKICKGDIFTLVSKFEDRAYRRAMALEKAFLHISRQTTVLCIEVAHEAFKIARLRVPLSFDSLKSAHVLVLNNTLLRRHDFAALFHPSREEPHHGLVNQHRDLVLLSICCTTVNRSYNPLLGQQHVLKNLKKNLEGEALAPVVIERDSTSWAIGALEFLKFEKICPAFPVLSVTLGPTLKVALIKGLNHIVALELKAMNLLYPKLSNLLNYPGFATPLCLLEAEFFDQVFGDEKSFDHFVQSDLYQTHFDAFVEDVCGEIEKALVLEKSIATVLVTGEYSNWLKESWGSHLENSNRETYVVSPQMLQERKLPTDLMTLLGILRHSQGPSYTTTTYPTAEKIYEGLKGDSLVDLYNHQVMLKQDFDVSVNVTFTKLDPSDPQSHVVVTEETAEGKVPVVIFRVEESSDFAKMRLKALKLMRMEGFKRILRPLKNKANAYLTVVGRHTYACSQYLMPDADQETLKSRFSFKELLAFSVAFHLYAQNNFLTKKLSKSRLDEFLGRFSYFEDDQLKQWNSAIFSSRMWTKVFDFAQYFKSDLFQNCYRNLPVHLIHGDLKPSDLQYVKGKPMFIDLPDMRSDVRVLDFAGYTDWSFFAGGHIDETGILALIAKHFSDLTFIERINFHRILIFRKMEKLSRVLQSLSQALNAEALHRIEPLQEELIRLVRDLYRHELF